MAIKCSVCREPIGPPASAVKKPNTIAATPENVNALLRQRLHPELQEKPSPYKEGIVANQSDAFALLQRKERERIEREFREAEEKAAKESGMATATATVEAPTSHVDPVVAASASAAMAEEQVSMPPPVLPSSPSTEVVTQPTASAPPLMAALQAAMAEGDAIKATETPRRGRRG